jgi:hypothetical protein
MAATRAKPRTRRAAPKTRSAKRAPAKRAPAKRTASPPGKAPSLDPVLAAKQLAKVRAVARALPDASERLSHGSPSFYLGGKRAFMYFCDNHHHDGRLALWCCAPEGAQAMLVDSNPDVYFLPPYVAHLGWVGVRLDRDAAWPEIAAVIEAAHHTRGARKR